MNEFYVKAIERLRDDKGLSGNKERAMAPAVREALEKFCEEDGEFAQAVAQGGSFPECMQAVAKGVGGSISDIEAYRKAVQFYFPGAEIETTMHVRLCGRAVYRVPWEVWWRMKEHFGLKYMTAEELEPYRVQMRRGMILFLGDAG